MQIKPTLIESGIFEDNVYCHLVSGLGAGFFAVCFGSPVDVVKSRLMGMALLCKTSSSPLPPLLHQIQALIAVASTAPTINTLPLMNEFTIVCALVTKSVERIPQQ